MPGSFEIQRAGASDADLLARMRADSAFERHGGDPGERERYAATCHRFFAAELAKPDSFLRSWIAYQDGIPAGAASLAIVPTFPRYGSEFGGYDARIRDVYVVPERRGSGIATALVRFVIAQARLIPADRLSLGSSAMGRPLYERLGFVAKTDEMVFEW